MHKEYKQIIIALFYLLVLSSCKNKNSKESSSNYEVNTTRKERSFEKGTFGYDIAFLQKHYKNTIVLESNDRKSMIVLSPELQGRVMTSTLNGDEGMSFGWLN
jgi:hypothetical protein